jgi:hypothetical protein
VKGYLCGESLPKLALDDSRYLREGKVYATPAMLTIRRREEGGGRTTPWNEKVTYYGLQVAMTHGCLTLTTNQGRPSKAPDHRKRRCFWAKVR